MQFFRDNEKKQLKMANSWPFWILYKYVMSYTFKRHYILLYIHGQAILLCF